MNRRIRVACGKGLPTDSIRFVTVHTSPEEYGYQKMGNSFTEEDQTYIFSPAAKLKLSTKKKLTSSSQITIGASQTRGGGVYTGPSILHNKSAPKPTVLKHGYPYPDVETPKNLPVNSLHITTVQRQFHMEYTQNTAYHISTNTLKKQFFLIERREDILTASAQKFVHDETTCFVETASLSEIEAASLLLFNSWRYERAFWKFSKFDQITQSGLLSEQEADFIANLAWGFIKVHHAPYGGWRAIERALLKRLSPR